MHEDTLKLAIDKYDSIRNRCDELGQDIFETKLLFENTVCMRGPESAKFFYCDPRLTRRNAAPRRLRKTLFGEGGVQGLEGVEHYERKRLFLELLTGRASTSLGVHVDREWNRRAEKWQTQDAVVLADELPKLVGEAALRWVGIPNSWVDFEQVIEDLSDLIVGSGSVGPRHWRARHARSRLDAQFAELIRRARGLCSLDEDAPFARLARFRNAQGDELSQEVAAVELNNLVRPIVAVSWFITALARNWHVHREARRYVERGGAEHAKNFVQETRRTYPFFPFVAARSKENFQWSGQVFSQGELVLLDLYGTNHYEPVWSQPDHFDPSRFESTPITPYNFVPQGGGEHFAGHRCAGEWVTLALMTLALRKLRELNYSLEDQDLSLDEKELPTGVRSGVVLRHVRISQTGRDEMLPQSFARHP